MEIGWEQHLSRVSSSPDRRSRFRAGFGSLILARLILTSRGLSFGMIEPVDQVAQAIAIFFRRAQIDREPDDHGQEQDNLESQSEPGANMAIIPGANIVIVPPAEGTGGVVDAAAQDHGGGDNGQKNQ